MENNEIAVDDVTPFRTREKLGGTQDLYRFENGYGASVINHADSYGTELAVIKFNGEEFHLTYDTPITDDVIGHITTVDELRELLLRIKNL